jgi:ATP-dependent RNA helicase MSS116
LVSNIASRPRSRALAPSIDITSRSTLSVLTRFQPQLYSTDAVAATEFARVASQESSETITKFTDREKLGVHDSVVGAITNNFGCQGMTDA